MKTKKEVPSKSKEDLKQSLLEDLGFISYEPIPGWANELAENLLISGWVK